MKARAYVMGRAVPLEGVRNPGSTILEVELDDGRTVQLCVDVEGHIHLRAWGNIPAKVGNSTQASFDCQLNLEEQTSCPTCYGRLGECNCDA
jgi:hypothetical protein